MREETRHDFYLTREVGWSKQQRQRCHLKCPSRGGWKRWKSFSHCLQFSFSYSVLYLVFFLCDTYVGKMLMCCCLNGVLGLGWMFISVIDESFWRIAGENKGWKAKIKKRIEWNLLKMKALAIVVSCHQIIKWNFEFSICLTLLKLLFESEEEIWISEKTLYMCVWGERKKQFVTWLESRLLTRAFSLDIK